MSAMNETGEARVRYYLRPIKEQQLRERYAQPFECRSNLRVEEYENAVILPLRSEHKAGLAWGVGGGY